MSPAVFIAKMRDLSVSVLPTVMVRNDATLVKPPSNADDVAGESRDSIAPASMCAQNRSPWCEVMVIAPAPESTTAELPPPSTARHEMVPASSSVQTKLPLSIKIVPRPKFPSNVVAIATPLLDAEPEDEDDEDEPGSPLLKPGPGSPPLLVLLALLAPASPCITVAPGASG